MFISHSLTRSLGSSKYSSVATLSPWFISKHSSVQLHSVLGSSKHSSVQLLFRFIKTFISSYTQSLGSWKHSSGQLHSVLGFIKTFICTITLSTWVHQNIHMYNYTQYLGSSKHSYVQLLSVLGFINNHQDSNLHSVLGFIKTFIISYTIISPWVHQNIYY